MKLSNAYARELCSEIGYMPTWLPSVKISPGDIGRIVNSEFVHISSLSQMGVPMAVVTGNNLAHFHYESANAVNVEYKIAGTLPPIGSTLSKADAGVHIKFGRAKAIVFQVNECTSSMLANREKIERIILGLCETGDWPNDFVLVSEAVSASSATILMSTSRDSHVDLISDLRLPNQCGAPSLTSSGMKSRREHHIGTSIVAESGLTPLFKLIGIRRPFLRKPMVREVRRRLDDSDEIRPTDFDIGEVDYLMSPAPKST